MSVTTALTAAGPPLADCDRYINVFGGTPEPVETPAAPQRRRASKAKKATKTSMAKTDGVPRRAAR